MKVRLIEDKVLDCYVNGSIESVKYSKGTIFDVEEFNGEYYNCESKEGTIPIFEEDCEVIA